MPVSWIVRAVLTARRTAHHRHDSGWSCGCGGSGGGERAVLWFALRGITVERVLTDNGSCYRSWQWAAACTANNVAHKRTQPYRPQTNGKVERFHRILLEEWAYIRGWTSETERVVGYD